MGVWDNPAGLSFDVPALKPVTIGSENNPVGKIYVDELHANSEVNDGVETASAYHLTDSADKNYAKTVYAAGTAYSLTATPAALTFGTTSPSLTLDKAGTYLLLARVNVKYVAATFAAARTVTLKLRRTNNTAADLTNGTLVATTDIITTLTYTFGVFDLPRILYTTTNTDDAITIFGDVSAIPSAGSLDAIAAEIVAVRLY